MSKLLHTIERDTHVGIWDTEDIARIYEDRTIAHIDGVRWVNNSGSLHTYKHRITGAAHDRIKAAMADDCDETAWEIIYRATEHY